MYNKIILKLILINVLIEYLKEVYYKLVELESI